MEGPRQLLRTLECSRECLELINFSLGGNGSIYRRMMTKETLKFAAWGGLLRAEVVGAARQGVMQTALGAVTDAPESLQLSSSKELVNPWTRRIAYSARRTEALMRHM